MSASSISDTAAASARRRLPSWLNEPLLHFLLLGGLLFGLDHLLASRADDPRTIVVGPDVDREAVQLFESARGRKPNAAELAALRQVWLDNEVLYREGLALAVDKGDSAIRERVIFKALSVVDTGVRLPEADDATLRAWFEQHRNQYDEPARYDFDEAALSGDASEAAVRRFVTELQAGAPGDSRAGLRVFKGRPLASIVQTYGDELATTLDAMTPGEWRAIHTRDGWRAMRLGLKTPGQPSVFEAQRNVVLQDWRDAVGSEQRSAAVKALTGKYKVRYETAAP